MLERSPYHRFAYSEAEVAVSIIRKGLLVNPWSAILKRRMGVYAIAAGDYHEAVGRLDTCLRRSRDHPLLMVFLGIAVIGAGNEKHGTDLIEAGASQLSETQLAALEKELVGLIRDEKVAERVREVLNPPLRSLDQWAARRVDLGMATVQAPRPIHPSAILEA